MMSQRRLLTASFLKASRGHCCSLLLLRLLLCPSQSEFSLRGTWTYGANAATHWGATHHLPASLHV
eukprot:7977610-Alexandrium_andersonii.AAC.1